MVGEGMIANLIKKLPSISHDKANHFIYGSIIAAATSPFIGVPYTMVVVSVFAIGKEVIDKVSKKGTPSVADIVATVVGGVVVVLPTAVEKFSA